MTTTISVSPKRQVELPKDFCVRKKIKAGTALRVTEVGDGLYVTPVPEPTEKELREIIAAAGSLTRRQSSEEEEMVQQVFFKLWERNENLSLTGSVSAYLYRAVHNESLNYIKHQKVRSNHQLHIAYSMKNEVEHPAKEILSGELEKKIHSALNELPEQCRTIFQMSRFDELKYREIADKLGISVKTVENQMGKALKLLREKLVDFLVLILLFIHF